MSNKSSRTRGGNIAKGKEEREDRNFSVYIEKSRECQKRRRGVLRREVFNDLAGY